MQEQMPTPKKPDTRVPPETPVDVFFILNTEEDLTVDREAGTLRIDNAMTESAQGNVIISAVYPDDDDFN